ncbi:MAG: sugar phosphate nucleotidyltransferase [Candidatus Methanoperedens sp.]|nr:sugar phosphate nucleotidyltransferase [Candidatus Methanoperedens sp.]MCZ7396171.1 sugar phosphate nucleotidyltransferase [Candidatus Methanoperedens sp.]
MNKEEMKAVILAGGKGTRLKPFTTVFPKPLMPIDDKPIIEIVIRQLKSCGINEIIMAVGHLSELIMAFLGDGSKYGVKIKYSREDIPLGTVGGLGLIKNELKETFLMMNGDVLTTLNYSELVNFHKRNGAVATIALNKRYVKIDFGVVELEESTISKYIEKPSIDYLVSMGVYVFEPRVLEYIKLNTYLDFPDLIKKLISNGETVKGYVYDGYWLDIGRPDDYEKANNEIDSIFNKLGIASVV